MVNEITIGPNLYKETLAYEDLAGNHYPIRSKIIVYKKSNDKVVIRDYWSSRLFVLPKENILSAISKSFFTKKGKQEVILFAKYGEEINEKLFNDVVAADVAKYHITE